MHPRQQRLSAPTRTDDVGHVHIGLDGLLTCYTLIAWWRRDPVDPFRLGIERPVQDLIECHTFPGRCRAIETVVTGGRTKQVDEREDEEEGQDEEGWEQDEETTAALRMSGRLASVS